MTQKVFLDTNILVDLLLTRQPFNQQAEQIFELSHSRALTFYISALSVANIAYLVKKSALDEVSVIKKLLYWTDVVELNKTIFENALISGFRDFEDAIQYCSAQTVEGIDIIITRNKKDFKASVIPVLDPIEFLDLYS